MRSALALALVLSLGVQPAAAQDAGTVRSTLPDVREPETVSTATAGEVPESQVGASITVLDSVALDALGYTDLLDAIRSVPGVAVVQVGARGGPTSLSVRGGAANFNKIVIDGVPANDVGGAFDLADLASTGVARVEVLRGSNSTLYGSDAMAGVVNITTRRGRSRIPEATLSIDRGNFDTAHGDASLGGAVKRFDYFADYSHLQTDNSVSNNAYRNDTLASRVGMTFGSNTDLSGTIRWIETKAGSPNAINFYKIADDSSQTRTAMYASVAARTQISDRWRSTIQFGVADQALHYVNPVPTGTPSNSSPFINYLGDEVTIDGANGYAVTGRAILDYGGAYPRAFDSNVARSLLSGQSDFQVGPSLAVGGGARLEHESGKATSIPSALSAMSPGRIERTNYGAFLEARASAFGSLYVTSGLGVEHNQVFGSELVPRVSVAAYLRQLSSVGALEFTKLTFNVGKGIKEPSLGQELSSLFRLISPDIAAATGVEPIGPERSRTLDVGLEQGLARGHGRVRAIVFNNEFRDLIEFVSRSVLPLAGVSIEAAIASGFGAYVNSQSVDAKGVELSGEALARGFRFTASYTYLDAVVTKSLSGGALFPAENPAFPGIPIGRYSPLVGARPFRSPANSGSLTVAYTGRKAHIALAAYFVGKQDDSTFLSDAFFGDSLLLPNKDLDAAYQKFDISGSYKFHPSVRAYVTIENAFDEQFEAAAGFPALPRTFRAGVMVSLGGDSPTP